jgi:hypothetical protein
VKALSLRQPWATLVAIGAKQIETRSWSTTHRGIIAIHAATKFPRACRTLAHETEPFRSVISHAALPGEWEEHLPLGAILATARLEHCYRFDKHPAPRVASYSDAPHELVFGDFSPGRFGFVLRDLVILLAPIPARGALGLWEWQEPW